MPFEFSICFFFSTSGALKVRTAASLLSAKLSTVFKPPQKDTEVKVNQHVQLCCKQIHLTRAANGSTQQG